MRLHIEEHLSNWFEHVFMLQSKLRINQKELNCFACLDK